MNTSRQVEQRKSVKGSLSAADCNGACLSIHLTQLSKPALQLLLLSLCHAFTIGISVCLDGFRNRAVIVLATPIFSVKKGAVLAPLNYFICISFGFLCSGNTLSNLIESIPFSISALFTVISSDNVNFLIKFL